MKPTTTFECGDCGCEFEYAPAADGSVPEGCPECDSDNVEELETP